jgi:4a-hydroxytetrahydrobiopterin dehydratase
MKKLSVIEIGEFLATGLTDWSYDGTSLSRNFRFPDFVTAFAFMSAVALKAEKLDHHPDWSNIYNVVYIRLNTHDAGGITNLDIELAKQIDAIFGLYHSDSHNV